MRDSFHCFLADPLGAYAGLEGDANRRADAQDGSRRLLERLLSYGLKFGLPNLGLAQIRIRLNDLNRSPPPEPPKQRAPHPDAWSPDEDAKILRFRATGLSYGQIAMRLMTRGRTGDAVAARLRILGQR